MSGANEPSSVPRFTGPGVPGSSQPFASSSRLAAENTDGEFIDTSRPIYEQPCLEALEHFRIGKIDRITATTNIGIAISDAVLTEHDEEAQIFERYFSIIERIADELRSAETQTRTGSSRTVNSKGETRSRDKHESGQRSSDKGKSKEGTFDQSHKRKATRTPSVDGSDRSSIAPDSPDDSDSSSESSNGSTTASDSTSDVSIHRRKKRVKLDFSYLKRVTKENEWRTLPPLLQRANQLVANWANDIKTVVRRYDLSSCRPEFPTSELKHILEGKFVNLDAVLTYHYTSQSCDKQTEKVGDLEFTFAPTTFTRAVNTGPDWITAWGRAEHTPTCRSCALQPVLVDFTVVHKHLKPALQNLCTNIICVTTARGSRPENISSALDCLFPFW